MKTSELETWETRFARELSLRGATGREVGEALETVRAHCRDAMVHPDTAFGSPVAYARQLRPGPLRARRVGRLLLGCGAASALALLNALGPDVAWTSPVTVTLGGIVVGLSVLGILLGTILVLDRRGAAGNHPGRWALAIVTVGVVLYWLMTALQQPITHVAAGTIWGAAAILLAAGALARLSQHRDRPRDPITGAVVDGHEAVTLVDLLLPALVALRLLTTLVRML